MDIVAFLDELRSAPDYAGQIVYVRRVEPRQARYGSLSPSDSLSSLLTACGFARLYCHQSDALSALAQNRDVLIATGTASGKSLCYTLPLLQSLRDDPSARAILLFPTKALAQDQFRVFQCFLARTGLGHVLAGVYDGDTPGDLRRMLRDQGRVIFTNPDMLHAAVMPQHGRWAEFLANLRFLVIDEMHVYNGIFGSNMANLLRRFDRVCGHYGSRPRVIGCSATLAAPGDLAGRLTGRDVHVVDDDGSPRGGRTYVFWNPPRIRPGHWHGRRSANVEAHELFAALIRRHVPTIVFSKSKMTAEMIHRYVCENLADTAPGLGRLVTPYRGGYRPEERRAIEKRLFDGELIGVSATRALELGIDVGSLEASIIVGYPGTLTSFFQQAGRAGRRDREALVILVGLDTAVNQYVLTNPDYLFARPIEQAVIDADNPFVAAAHLRCAAHELPLADAEVAQFGPAAPSALRVLEENRKLHHAHQHWYHSSSETPQHEIPLRDTAGANTIIQDADTGQALGEVNRFDAPPILHPGAVYMHLGQTYLVESLDMERNIAIVRQAEVDYYTNPLGGTDVHHVDHRLREKPFGAGLACWGEVTAYFNTNAYQKIHFYSLDVVSVHRVTLPTLHLETMALWLIPPEPLLERVRAAGLDVHAGLRGIGYATRMLLPLFLTCDTLDFSHSIGSVNSPWQAVFIYERYPLGLGFTEKAYERLHDIMPAVLAAIRACPCDEGCPCCVGKPLRQDATWYVDLGEASIPSKASAVMILEGLLAGDLLAPDTQRLSDTDESETIRLEQALRRRLERMREPHLFHPIEPKLATGYPAAENPQALETSDVAVRNARRTSSTRELRKRLTKRIHDGTLAAAIGRPAPPEGMITPGGNARPTDFPGVPQTPAQTVPDDQRPQPPAIALGDSLAARAMRLKRANKKKDL